MKEITKKTEHYFPLARGWKAATRFHTDFLVTDEFGEKHGAAFAFDSTAPRTDVRPDEIGNLLARFVALRTRESIEAFIVDGGALELCRHGLPHLHQPGYTALNPKYGADGEPLDGCDPLTTEPLHLWLEWIAKFAALREIAEGLRRPTPHIASAEVWRDAGFGLEHNQPPGLPASAQRRALDRAAKLRDRHSERNRGAKRLEKASKKLDGVVLQMVDGRWRKSLPQPDKSIAPELLEQAWATEVSQLTAAGRQEWIDALRSALLFQINSLLDMGGLRPMIVPEAGVTQLKTGWLYGSGLFGTLAMQLALYAADKASYYNCATCSKAIQSTRKRYSRSGRFYCDDCRDGRARSLLQHEWYAKNREKILRKRRAKRSAAKAAKARRSRRRSR